MRPYPITEQQRTLIARRLEVTAAKTSPKQHRKHGVNIDRWFHVYKENLKRTVPNSPTQHINYIRLPIGFLKRIKYTSTTIEKK